MALKKKEQHNHYKDEYKDKYIKQLEIENVRLNENLNMKKLFPLLLLFLMSCSKNTEVSIQFDSINGITKGTDVTIDGFKVGAVKNIYISENNSVITTVEIDDKIILYHDATFSIKSSLMGDREIVIYTGDSDPLLDKNKLIIGISDEKILTPDSTGVAIGGFLKSIFKKDNTKQDSILIELRRLNENLEKLENK